MIIAIATMAGIGRLSARSQSDSAQSVLDLERYELAADDQ